MRTQLIVLGLATAAIVACSSNSSTGPNAGEYDKIELAEEGGFAAISVNRMVRHDDRSYAYSLRHLCTTNCGAPLDSAGGTLSQTGTDSVFNAVAVAQPFGLKDDYGTTNGAADMLTYTLRITLNQNTKTIRADDGTMPPEMRLIVTAMHASISGAHQ